MGSEGERTSIAVAYELLRRTKELPIYVDEKREKKETKETSSSAGDERILETRKRRADKDGRESESVTGKDHFLWVDTYDKENRDIPRPPKNGDGVTYEVLPDCRVVRADLNGVTGKVGNPHRDFLLSCMDRPDVTLIIRGLFAPLQNNLWKWNYLVRRCGRMMYHAFKVFRWSEESETFEPGGWISMTIADYDRYLQLRLRLTQSERRKVEKNVENIDRITNGSTAATTIDSSVRYYETNPDGTKTLVDRMISIQMASGEVRLIDAATTSVYLIDLPLATFLPELMIDLESKARIDLMPSGRYCMQRFIAPGSRPFMGPNLYVTPPGASTYFHEDGHGTVDSGHLALTGYNEVVMLRRLGHVDKERALDILRGGVDYRLRVEPHDDSTFKTKPPWPSCDQIDELRGYGYEPSHFILQPGEYVHINKGRLHAFRKVRPLPTNACVRPSSAKNIESADFRRSLTESPEVCVSIAWDWIFQGRSPQSIRQEAGLALENAKANRRGAYPVFSLGRTESVVIGALQAALAQVKTTCWNDRRHQEKTTDKRSKDAAAATKTDATRRSRRQRRRRIKLEARPFWTDQWITGGGRRQDSESFGSDDEDIGTVVGRGEARDLLRGLSPILLGHIAKTDTEDAYRESSATEPTADSKDKVETAATSLSSRTREEGMLSIAYRIFQTTHKELEDAHAKIFQGRRLLSEDRQDRGESKGKSDEGHSKVCVPSPEQIESIRKLVSEARDARRELGRRLQSSISDLRALARRQLFHGRAGRGAIVNDAFVASNSGPVVDASVPRLKQTVDPFYSDGFTCEVCFKELSNVYFHCLGCEFLKKDFNVCVECARSHRHEVTARAAKTTTDGHYGAIDWSIRQRPGKLCSRHRQRSCQQCGFCIMCSCRCHTVLQKRYRFVAGATFSKFARDAVRAAEDVGGGIVMRAVRTQQDRDSFVFDDSRCILRPRSKVTTGGDIGQAFVGRAVQKIFPSQGIFRGRVAKYFPSDRLFSIRYDDGDNEDVSLEELQTLLNDSVGPPHNTSRPILLGCDRKHDADERLYQDVNASRIFNIENSDAEVVIRSILSGARSNVSATKKRKSSYRKYTPKVAVYANASDLFECECGKAFSMAKAIRVHMTKMGHRQCTEAPSAENTSSSRTPVATERIVDEAKTPGGSSSGIKRMRS